MNFRRIISLLCLTVFLSGCTNLIGSLRRDLDDSEAYSPPTIGGRWSERGFLADEYGDEAGYEDRYAVVGHSERSPASDGYSPPEEKRSWVNGDSNRRDVYRTTETDEEGQAVAFSNTPSIAPPVKRQYKNGMRATRADFMDEAPNEGSLWASDGQTNYYFTKNKVRGVGDIVTITIEEDLFRDASLEMVRTLSPREKERELSLAQDRLDLKSTQPKDEGKSNDLLTTMSSGPSRTPAAKPAEKKSDSAIEDESSRKATVADIDLGGAISLKTGDTMMAEIVDRYPNGNYKLRGTKKITYRNSFRLLTVVAVARGTDISEEDLVNSGKLYEYRLEVVR